MRNHVANTPIAEVESPLDNELAAVVVRVELQRGAVAGVPPNCCSASGTFWLL